jgi:hypothetical protein
MTDTWFYMKEVLVIKLTREVYGMAWVVRNPFTQSTPIFSFISLLCIELACQLWL